MFPGTFAPWNDKFPGTFVLGSESPQWELSLQGAKIPGSEKSLNHVYNAHVIFSGKNTRRFKQIL